MHEGGGTVTNATSTNDTNLRNEICQPKAALSSYKLHYILSADNQEQTRDAFEFWMYKMIAIRSRDE